MRTIVASLAAMVLMASAASAQTEQNSAGTGGTSKPGVQGLPGGKSGATVKGPNTTTPAPAESSGGTQAPGESKLSPLPAPSANSQDESKVPGIPGSKSGPSSK